MSNLRLFESKKAGFQCGQVLTEQAVKAGFYPLSKIRAGFQKAGRFSMVIRVTGRAVQFLCLALHRTICNRLMIFQSSGYCLMSAACCPLFWSVFAKKPGNPQNGLTRNGLSLSRHRAAPHATHTTHSPGPTTPPPERNRKSGRQSAVQFLPLVLD